MNGKPVYDDEIFFSKYAQMYRSLLGLSGAGEWNTLEKILPDFKGKRVLDLGCGYGWHAAWMAGKGAARITAVDVSVKMLEKAKSMHTDSRIEYILEDIESFDAAPSSYDIVFSSLVFHYVSDYSSLVRKISRWLSEKGMLIFTVEHPVFTSRGDQDWIYNSDGSISHFPVDNYYYEGERTAVFLGEKVRKYHRSLTTYIETLLEEGFSIQHVIEPQPPENMMDRPGYKDEMRRPMMLIISARKN